jgi:hypothetical protein
MTRIKKFIVDLRPLTSNKYGGVQTVNRNFIEQIVKNLKNDQQLVFFTSGLSRKKIHLPKLDTYLAKKNIRHKHLKLPNVLLNITFNLLNFPKIDKVCSLYSKNPKKKTSFMSLDVRPFAVSKHCKSIIYFHDVAFIEQKKALSLKARFYFKLINPKQIFTRASKIITNSDFSRRKLRKHFGKQPVQIVYPSVKKPQNRTYKKSSSNVIFAIQTLQKRKNIQEILKIAEQNPKHQFVIAGAHNNTFKKERYKSAHNIQFVGEISDKKKREYIKLSKAVLYTSKYEGFGLPIYESLVYKTPVICHKVKPFTQLFANIKLNYIEDLDNYKIPKKLIQPYKPYRFSLKKSGRSLTKILEKNS